MHLGCRGLRCSFKIKREKPCNTLEDTRKCPSSSNIVFLASAKENQETKQKIGKYTQRKKRACEMELGVSPIHVKPVAEGFTKHKDHAQILITNPSVHYDLGSDFKHKPRSK
jgi:hypothetical protein